MPKGMHFPKRNRLISAWSRKVLIVEAGLKSGALITANLALKYGRQLLAVPGGIYNIESIGCNNLIAEGANSFLKSEQLLLDKSSLPIKNTNENRQMRSSENIDNMNDLEEMIFGILREEEKITIAELSRILNTLTRGSTLLPEWKTIYEFDYKNLIKSTY